MVSKEPEAEVRQQRGADGIVEAGSCALVLYQIRTRCVAQPKARSSRGAEDRLTQQVEAGIIVACKGVNVLGGLVVQTDIRLVAIVIAVP